MSSVGGSMLFARILRWTSSFLILCLLLHVASVLPQQDLSAQTKRAQESVSTPMPAATPKDRQIAASAIHLPLFFEANEGQTDPSVRYLTRSNGYTMFLAPTETVLVEEKTVSTREDKFDGLPARFRTDAKSSSRSVLRMKLLGANSAPEFQAL